MKEISNEYLKILDLIELLNDEAIKAKTVYENKTLLRVISYLEQIIKESK